MALIDYIIADIKQLHEDMSSAKTLEEYQKLANRLGEKLALYDKERGKK